LISLLLVWPVAAFGGEEGAGETLLIGEGNGAWEWETTCINGLEVETTIQLTAE
jgi:hypothetical protein